MRTDKKEVFGTFQFVQVKKGLKTVKNKLNAILSNDLIIRKNGFLFEFNSTSLGGINKRRNK